MHPNCSKDNTRCQVFTAPLFWLIYTLSILAGIYGAFLALDLWGHGMGWLYEKLVGSDQ